MQDAISDVEVTTSDPKEILMLRAFVMYPNLVSPHHHQGKLAGGIIHRVPTHRSQGRNVPEQREGRVKANGWRLPGVSQVAGWLGTPFQLAAGFWPIPGHEADIAV